MARARRIIEEPKPTAMIASAARLGKGYKTFSNMKRGASDAWQRDAWHAYHTIGEFRFSCDWVGSMLSRAVLAVTKKDANGHPEPQIEGDAFEYLDALFGDDDGRAEMLRMIGIHLTVAGECFIVGYDNPEDDSDDDVWKIVASTEFKQIGETGPWTINGNPIPVEHDQVFVTRIWRPDPVDENLAVAPARAVLPILGEIARLTDHVAAQVDSRLAGAGILLMPSEMTFPAPPEASDPEAKKVSVSDADDLMKVLQDTMETAIEDRGDASARVPIVITAPADAIGAVEHMTFWTDLDEHAIELRSEAIRRLGLGMDMPPEVLTGSADSNQWSAWQADESSIKAHTEPLLKVITTALAKGYLRPMLRSTEGFVDEVMDYSISADTAELRLRPNRSKEALELYNMGVLSEAALRRETGFDENDKMDDEEQVMWFTRKIASGSTTPELVGAALKRLGVELEVAPVGDGETQEAPSDPTLKDHPVRDIPDREISERRKEIRDDPNQSTAPLVAAAEQVVIRAMERAGNKLKSKVGS